MTQANAGTANPKSVINTDPNQPLTDKSRWVQLFMGILCMAMIANLQYGWSRAATQVAFTNFVL